MSNQPLYKMEFVALTKFRYDGRRYEHGDTFNPSKHLISNMRLKQFMGRNLICLKADFVKMDSIVKEDTSSEVTKDTSSKVKSGKTKKKSTTKKNKS